MADWEEELGLNNVRPFDKPMAAGKNDKVVGQDELGNTLYETPTGQRYSVRPASEEESKTTRGKVEDWVDEGAPLPSWDQIVESAKAAPQAAYDSVAGMVRGEGTYGDVIGAVATMAAPGASKAFDAFDPNTTRMFFGPDSPAADRDALDRAERMSENGYSPEEVWLSTGWWNSPNGWRFEVSDKDMQIHPNLLTKAEELAPVNLAASGKLTDAVRHPEFFNALLDDGNLTPSSRRVLVGIKDQESGSYQLGAGNISVKGRDKDTIKSVLLHEMQHLVQDAENNVGKGANPEAIASDLNKTLSQLPRDALEYLVERRERDRLIAGLSNERLELRSRLEDEPEIKTDPSLMADYEFLEERYTNAITDLKRDRNSKAQVFQRQFSPEFKKSVDDFYTATLGFTDYLEKTDDGQWVPLPKEQAFEKLRTGVAFDLYQRDPGEAEARLVQTRKDLDQAERAMRFPEKDYDIDPNTLIDKYDLRKITNNMLSELDNVRGRRGYAEGGMVENPNIDPVSGNPVPTGAKPEEVRDDVPIMASEGEYVIPANVVRYIGLDRIEKMVKQAKKGLTELDAEGRIGGEKATMDEDLPFSPEELIAVEEAEASASPPSPAMMAEGGLVSSNNMDIDPATGLPRWLLAMQQNQMAPATSVAAPTPVPTPTVSTGASESSKRGSEGGERRNAQPAPTGLSKPVDSWSVEDYNKYSTFRNSPDSKIMQGLASVIPGAGLLSNVAQRTTERKVDQNLTEMLRSGRDLNGKPLSTEQLSTLRDTYTKITGEPISKTSGFAGVAQAIARDTGLIKPRTPTEEQVDRYNQRVKGDGLINKAIDFLTGSSKPKPATNTSSSSNERRNVGSIGTKGGSSEGREAVARRGDTSKKVNASGSLSKDKSGTSNKSNKKK